MPNHWNVKPNVFREIAKERFQTPAWRPPCLREYKAHFGIGPILTSRLWNRLANEFEIQEDHWRPEHLLDALFFMKVNPNDYVNKSFCKRDPKTLRKWNWKIIATIAEAEWVRWENRLVDDNGSICEISLDGTDFEIPEPSPFDPIWCSHKCNGPSLRCEVGVAIQTMDIVWINGPFPAGDWPDLRIARDSIIDAIDLAGGEMILADGGHCDDYEFFETPAGENNADQRMKAKVRARHETVNRCFKVWAIIGKKFKHRLHKHGICVHAIANITQLCIMEGGNRWPVACLDN